MKELDKITPLEKDFSKWYQDVIKQGNLIEYGNAKGLMIYKPISFGIWENIQKEMNKIFCKLNVENVYLPLLIPQSYIEKEKDHVEGFAPELAMVTKIADKVLEEPLVIRPTSEVLFGELFSKSIRSYKDLPIIYNQWVNVIRWEKTTNPFLRNREFLWQEGHTIHATKTEAMDLTKKMIKTYAKFLKDFLAIPVIIGEKTLKEKFAGAISTYTIEAMMKDGKALQSGTSHYLGQNFAKAFDIQFTSKDNKKEFGYQTSWGVSTRLIGALIMSHSDNRGIIIPPKIAPTQVDLIPLFANKHEFVKVATSDIFKKLHRSFRVKMDNSDKGPGFKAGRSEIQGTPLRVEIGPRDLENNEVTIVQRDTLKKHQVKIKNVKSFIKDKLNEIQENLYISAKERLDNNIVEVSTYEKFKKEIKNKKFVLVPFDGNIKDENNIKDKTGATARCIPFKYKIKEYKTCFITGKQTKRLVIFAKTY